MNKRRRTSSVASRGTEDDGDDIPPEPTKRRKKLDPVSTCIHLCIRSVCACDLQQFVPDISSVYVEYVLILLIY